MIRTYENFEELAECMCDGEGILHMYNCVANYDKIYADPCYAWQTGINNFAEWLDHIGVEVEIPENGEDFYKFIAKKYKHKQKEKQDG